MPKRAWFQFRLSTALLLMFISAGFLYINSKPYLIETNSGTTLYKGVIYPNIFSIYGYGWPRMACRHFIYGEKLIPEGYHWDTAGVVTDVGVALVALIAVGCLVEFVSRR